MPVQTLAPAGFCVSGRAQDTSQKDLILRLILSFPPILQKHVKDALGRYVIDRSAYFASDFALPTAICSSTEAQHKAGDALGTDPELARISGVAWRPVHLLGPLTRRRVRTVASSHSYSLAITEDGCVFAWGVARSGTKPKALHQVTGADLDNERACQAACGDGHYLILCDSGTVYAWGAADVGQLGLGKVVDNFVEKPVTVRGGLIGCKGAQVACGQHHSATVTTDGRLFIWGYAEGGRLGIGNLELLNLPAGKKGRFVCSPVQVMGILSGKLVTQVACGTEATFVLLEGGNICAWGVGISAQPAMDPVVRSATCFTPHVPATANGGPGTVSTFGVSCSSFAGEATTPSTSVASLSGSSVFGGFGVLPTSAEPRPFSFGLTQSNSPNASSSDPSHQVHLFNPAGFGITPSPSSGAFGSSMSPNLDARSQSASLSGSSVFGGFGILPTSAEPRPFSFGLTQSNPPNASSSDPSPQVHLFNPAGFGITPSPSSGAFGSSMSLNLDARSQSAGFGGAPASGLQTGGTRLFGFGSVSTAGSPFCFPGPASSGAGAFGFGCGSSGSSARSVTSGSFGLSGPMFGVGSSGSFNFSTTNASFSWSNAVSNASNMVSGSPQPRFKAKGNSVPRKEILAPAIIPDISLSASFEPVEIRFEIADFDVKPVAVSCYSGKNTCVVGSDGNIYRYSLRKFSKIDDLPANRFSFVSCGQDYSFAVDTQGILYAWGSIENGRLGVGKHFPHIQLLERETKRAMCVQFSPNNKVSIPEAMVRCFESQSCATLLGFDGVLNRTDQNSKFEQMRQALRLVMTSLAKISNIDEDPDIFFRNFFSDFVKAAISEPITLLNPLKSDEAPLISRSCAVTESFIHFCRSMPTFSSTLNEVRSVQEVADWLEGEGIAPDVVKNFQSEMVDRAALLRLSAADLSRMKVNKLGHRKALLRKIQDLQTQTVGTLNKQCNLYRYIRLLTLNLDSSSTSNPCKVEAKGTDQQVWEEKIVKDVLKLAASLCCNLGDESENSLSKIGSFYLSYAICGLVSTAAKVAARIPRSGACFLSPLLLKASGQASSEGEDWVLELPSHLVHVAMTSFMQCVTSAEQALQIIDPAMMSLEAELRDFSSFRLVMTAMTKYLYCDSFRLITTSLPPIDEGFYVAFRHLQSAIFFVLNRAEKWNDWECLNTVIFHEWILKFLDLVRTFFISMTESFFRIHEFEVAYLSSEPEQRSTHAESILNRSVFRELLPAFVIGLDSCDWSYFPPKLLSVLNETRCSIKSMLDSVPEWQVADQNLKKELWQAPSEFCKWFLPSFHMIRVIILRKPLEYYKGSEASAKWLDKGFIMMPNSTNANLSEISCYLANEEFWAAVEAHASRSHFHNIKLTELIRNATAVLSYHTVGKDFSNLVEPKDMVQIFANCTTAVNLWAAKVRPESDDLDLACARARFLLNIAHVNGSITFRSADEWFKEMFEEDEIPCIPALRRNSSRNLSESASSNWLLDFIFDKSVDPKVIQSELNRRNQRLESCLKLVEIMGFDRAQTVSNADLGEFLLASSHNRSSLLDGFGGADVGMQKKFQAAVVGVLSAAIKAEPSGDEAESLLICFGIFSALATLKINAAGVKCLLDLQIWEKLIDQLLNKDAALKLDVGEQGSSEAVDFLAFTVVTYFVLESFQDFKSIPEKMLEWRGSVLSGLVKWLLHNQKYTLGQRRVLDLLSLCTADIKTFVAGLNLGRISGSPNSVCLVSHCIKKAWSYFDGFGTKKSDAPTPVPTMFAFLSKLAICFSPNEFDVATADIPCIADSIFAGNSPSGLHFLLVFASQFGDCVQYELDPDFTAVGAYSPTTRIIMAGVAADFLSRLSRISSWQAAIKTFCQLYLTPDTVCKSSTPVYFKGRKRLSGIGLALSLLGGSIPVIREGGDATDTRNELLTVVQYKLGEEKALVAKQDGSLQHIAVSDLYPFYSVQQHRACTCDYVGMLLPFIHWHADRVLSESDLYPSISANTECMGGILGPFMNELSRGIYFFGRHQGAMVMRVLANFAVESPADVCRLLCNHAVGNGNAVDAINHIALFCADAEDFSNLHHKTHTLAEKAERLQLHVFDCLAQQTTPKIDNTQILSTLSRGDTLGSLQRSQVATFKSETIGSRAFSFGDKQVFSGNVGAAPQSEAKYDINTCIHELSTVQRELLILYSVNVSIELLPEYLSTNQTASVDKESNAHVIMRVLQLAVRIGLSSERLESVVNRLLSSSRPGVPQFFLQVLSNASNPSRWVSKSACASSSVIQTMQASGGEAWECVLSFNDSSQPISTILCDPSFHLFAVEKNAVKIKFKNRKGSSRRNRTDVKVERQGSTLAIVESDHNYADGVYYSGSIKIVGSSSLQIEFDSRCHTEKSCDVLTFYNDESFSTEICSFSGSDGWQSFTVHNTDSIFYKFRSDGSVNFWGYR